MELVLALQEESQIRVTCDDHYSHSADLHPLLTENASSILDDPASYGKKLYAALFPPQSIAQQALASMPERLLIVTSEPLLDAIPWEYIYGPYGVDDPTAPDYMENFLVLECPFVRGLPIAQRTPPPSLNQSLHIVAIPSNPLSETLHPLAIEEEWMRLKESIQPFTSAITLERTVPPTLERVRHLVANQKNRVVHFMGHGGQDQQQGAMLYFEHDNGALHLVTARELMQRVRGTLFLVTLNACVSATPGPTSFHNLAAALVKQKTPYALGMRFSILDEDARTFSRVFYNELARGVPVEEALFQSRLTLAQSRRSWVVGVPVLYTSLTEPAPGFVGHDGIPNVNEHQPHIDVTVLPPVEGTFQGRINDLIALGSNLTGDRRPRILTIIGSGGQGKTALARKLVERFAFAWSGGVWAGTLERLPTRSTFVIALAQFLGIETQQILDLAEIERQVLARLNERRTLLVLDNAETLVEAIEAQNADAFDLVAFLKKLLGTSACLLVTSRVPLGWDDEQTYELSGLSPEEGAALFQQGAPQRKHEIDLSVAASLSRQLEGHPLGLRLLTGAFNEISLSLPAFLQTTEERLREAENKYVGPEHRHRKLYACIETSVRALNPALRSLLSGLWIFHAPFLVDAVIAIFDPDTQETEQHPSPVRDQLYQLQRRSLLTRKTVTTRDGTLQLYALLPTTRPYVKHHLEQAYDSELLRKRFITVYALIARQAYSEVHRSTILARQVREDLEWVCEAFEQEGMAVAERGIYLLSWGWVVHRLGNSLRGLHLLERALEASQGMDSHLMLQISNSIAGVYQDTGRPQEALKFFEEVLSIEREVGNRTTEATTLNNIAGVYNSMGRIQEALKLYEEVLPIMREAGDRAGEAATLDGIAEAYRISSRPQEALKLFEEALPIMREAGDRAGEATILNNMALAYNATRQPQEALKFYEEALPIMRELNRLGEAVTLNNIGLVYAATRQPQEALKFYEEALPITREVGDRAGEAVTLNNIAGVYRDTGQLQEALKLFEEVLPIMREVGNRTGEASTLNGIAEVYRGTGRPQEALKFFEEVLSIEHVVGDRAGEATTLNTIAGLYRDTGRPQEALKFFEEVLSIKREVEDRAGEAMTLNSMADATGEPQEALKLFEEVLSIRREVGDRVGEAMTLNSMAGVHYITGRLQEALKFYEEALPIRREVGDHTGEAVTLNRLAYLYQSLQCYSDAATTLKQSMILSQQIIYPAAEIVGVVSLAMFLYRHSNLSADAITSLEQTFQVFAADAATQLGQALQIFATTGLSQNAAGQTFEQVQQLLAMILDETFSEASSTLPTETIQQIMTNTIAVMTVASSHRPEWIEAITNALQQAQQQGDDWQQERDFFTTILAILDGQSPTLPPDHPYAQAIEAIKQGITPPTGEETI